MSKINGILGKLKGAVPKRSTKTNAAEDAAGDTTPVHTPDAPFMRSINLLPDEFRPDTRRIRWKPAYVAASAAIALAVLAVGAMYMSASQKADDATGERDEVALQVQASQFKVQEEARKKGISALASVASTELSATVQGGLDERIAWDRVIGDTSRLLPEGVWLRAVQAATLSEGGDDAADTPGTLRLDGSSRIDKKEIAEYAARVKALRDVEGVVLENWTTTQLGEEEVFEFTISATVKGPR